jgi:hypothetical protein
MILAKQSAISFQQLSFFIWFCLKAILQSESMQSVAYKDQKNSIFLSDEPLLNAMAIRYIITNSIKVVMTSLPVFIYCKQLQKINTDFCYAKNQIRKLM